MADFHTSGKPAKAQQNAPPIQGSVLVVDDSDLIRDLLSRQLSRQGHQVITASDGQQALELMHTRSFDLVLLDIMMPEMDGYEVLEYIKADPTLAHLPVIVISAVGKLDSVVRCIELGAEEYLPKPFNQIILRARVSASLEKKRLRDKEQAYLTQLQAEQQKSEQLLLNILPQPIAERLKQGESIIADRFNEVTVLFADMVNFTQFWSDKSPVELVEFLNQVFSHFDRLAEHYSLEKIKTIGDAYMVVGGLPEPRRDHVEAVAEMALDIQRDIEQFRTATGHTFCMRIGIDTGSVVAGVIGERKFIYDLWGDTVNTADRMHLFGIPGRIQVTESVYRRLKDKYRLEKRGEIDVKGKGIMTTYFLESR